MRETQFVNISQLFRSITSDSAQFDINKTDRMNSKKGRVVDSSIAQVKILFLLEKKLPTF